MANIDSFIKEEVNKMKEKKIAKAREIGKEIMHKKRKAIVYEWFSRIDPALKTTHALAAIMAATQYKTHIIRGANGSVILEFYSYIDSDKYNIDTSSAERWTSKHGGDTSPREYILELQLNHGIVGLPYFASTYAENHGDKNYNGRGWSDGINQNFHANIIGLEEFTDNHGLWNDFAEQLRKQL